MIRRYLNSVRWHLTGRAMLALAFVLMVSPLAQADTVYTWRDAKGQIHLTSRLPATPHRLEDVNTAPSGSSGSIQAVVKPAAKPVDPKLDPIIRQIQDDANAATENVVSAKALFEKARQAYEEFRERARRNRNFKRRKRSVIESLKDQAEQAYDEYRQAVDNANEQYRRAEAARRAADQPTPAPR